VAAGEDKDNADEKDEKKGDKLTDEEKFHLWAKANHDALLVRSRPSAFLTPREKPHLPTWHARACSQKKHL
jgi:hypothetical protein